MASTRINPEYQPKGDYVTNAGISGYAFTMVYRKSSTSWNSVANAKTICKEILDSIAVSARHAIEIGLLESYGVRFYIAHAYEKGSNGKPSYGMLVTFSFDGTTSFYRLYNGNGTYYTLDKTQQ